MGEINITSNFLEEEGGMKSGVTEADFGLRSLVSHKAASTQTTGSQS